MATQEAPKKKLSVLKRARQNKKRQLRNKSMKSRIKTVTRKLEESIKENNRENTQEYLSEVIKTLDKASSKGILHKNTSSRKISRLAKYANSVLRSETA